MPTQSLGERLYRILRENIPGVRFHGIKEKAAWRDLTAQQQAEFEAAAQAFYGGATTEDADPPPEGGGGNSDGGG